MLDTELDVINLCLRKLGEPPVSSVDVQYPTIDLIRPALQEAHQNFLQEGWWFNTFDKVTLLPDINGDVQVSADTLVFYPDEPDKYTFTGTSVVKTDGVQVAGPVVGRRIVEIEFFKMPTAARYAVAYKTAAVVYAEDIGIDAVYQELLGLYVEAYRTVSTQHTKHRKFSSRNKLQVARWRSMLRS